MGSFLRNVGPFPLSDGPAVRAFDARFERDAYDDDLFPAHGIALPDELHNAVARRRAEYLAGRICASRCLEALGVETTDIPIGLHRNPLWPSGVKGAISHTGGYAVAVASSDAAILGIGVDVEKIDDRAFQEVRHLFLTAPEVHYLDAAPLDGTAARALAFSAKESFFKMAYPLVGEYFGFEAVAVETIDTTERTLNLRIRQHLHAELPPDRCFKVRYKLDGMHVTTLLIAAQASL